MPRAELIENSYRQADGVTGGYVSELWLITGQDPVYRSLTDDIPFLPRVGDPHSVVSNLTVRERVIENIIDKSTAIVRVDYRPISFDVGTTYSTSERHDQPLRLKLIWIYDDALDRDGTFIVRGVKLVGGPDDPEYDVLVETATRVVVVNAGGDIDAVTKSIIKNKGKLYRFGAFSEYIFIFINGQARKLKNGQVVAEYTFQALVGNSGVPLGTYPDQIYAVPPCPPNSMIFTSKNAAINGNNVYTIKPITSFRVNGSPLVGL